MLIVVRVERLTPGERCPINQGLRNKTKKVFVFLNPHLEPIPPLSLSVIRYGNKQDVITVCRRRRRKKKSLPLALNQLATVEILTDQVCLVLQQEVAHN